MSKEIVFNKELFNPLFYHLWELIRDDSIRTIVVYGGSSAAKTHTIAQVLALDGRSRSYSSAVFRKEQSIIKDTIKPEFNEVLDNVFNNESLSDTYTKYDFEYRSDGDIKIKFKGLDRGDKIKGLKGFKKVYLDELDQFLLKEWSEVSRRLRGDTNQQRIGAWNPVDENHWLLKDYISKIEWVEMPNVIEKYGEWSKLSDTSFVKKSKDGRTVLIKTTYLDNKYIVGGEIEGRIFGRIDNQCIADFEEMKVLFPDEYQVYGLGEWGQIKNNKPYFQTFSKKKQVKKGLQAIEEIELSVGIDFNYGRMAMVVGQKVDFQKIIIIDCIDGETIKDVCQKFDIKYGDWAWGVKIYGDASGKSSNAMTGAYNYFHEVKAALDLPDSAFTKNHNRNKNMEHSQSRTLCNYIFGLIPTYFDYSLDELIKEVQKAEVKVNESTGRENLRKDDGVFTMDRVDALRYLLENLLVDTEKVKKYREWIEVNNPDELENYANS